MAKKSLEERKVEALEKISKLPDIIMGIIYGILIGFIILVIIAVIPLFIDIGEDAVVAAEHCDYPRYYCGIKDENNQSIIREYFEFCGMEEVESWYNLYMEINPNKDYHLHCHDGSQQIIYKKGSL